MYSPRTLTTSCRSTFCSVAPSLRRTYAGSKQDDPSHHPTGANTEAAKDEGSLAKSQPSSGSNPADQSSKASSETASNAAVQEKRQDQPSQSSSGESRRKTVAEMDEELRQRMSGHSGDGGEAGVEYENGQPVAMKRSVRNNMFRLI